LNNMPTYAPTSMHTKSPPLATARLPVSIAPGPSGSPGKAPHRLDTPPLTFLAPSTPPTVSRLPPITIEPQPRPRPCLSSHMPCRKPHRFLLSPDPALSRSSMTSTRLTHPTSRPMSSPSPLGQMALPPPNLLLCRQRNNVGSNLNARLPVNNVSRPY
jgi:hypothetical protein